MIFLIAFLFPAHKNEVHSFHLYDWRLTNETSHAFSPSDKNSDFTPSNEGLKS